MGGAAWVTIGYIMRTSPERGRTGLGVTAAAPDDTPSSPSGRRRVPYLPWLAVAVAWSAAALVLGWAVPGALIGIAWLGATHIAPADMLAAIGQAWLSLHGAPVVLGGVPLRIVPLGLAALVAGACAVAARYAVRGASRPRKPAGASARLAIIGACVAGYLAPGLLVAAIMGTPAQMVAALPGLVLIPLVGASVGVSLRRRRRRGARRRDGWRPATRGWLGRLPRAIGLGVAVLAASATAAFVAALVVHWPTVMAVTESLHPDTAGLVMLIIVQLAYLPNMLLWAGSYVLGAGINLGPGAVAAPGVTIEATLPAVPVFGAVPLAPGGADLLWLLTGLLAGAASGAWLSRGEAWPGADRLPRDAALRGAGIRGALAGLGAAVVWIVLSWLSAGDLGVDRLAHLGPRFPALLGWGTVPLMVSAAAVAVAIEAWRRSKHASSDR